MEQRDMSCERRRPAIGPVHRIAATLRHPAATDARTRPDRPLSRPLRSAARLSATRTRNPADRTLRTPEKRPADCTGNY